MRCESDEVSWSIPCQEHLGALDNSISGIIDIRSKNLPAALPPLQHKKLKAITTDFLVWPATFLVIILMAKVWAAQKDRAM